MDTLFGKVNKALIGVVHLRPLPGSPRWGGNLASVIHAAVADAGAYERGGAHGLIVENFGDVPFTKGRVGPETIAAMTAAGVAIKEKTRLPIGFNVLRNDAAAALAICAACGGNFIRVNVHTGAMWTDQGLIEGNAFETLRYRRQICPTAFILADVHVKHATPAGAGSIEESARDTMERGLADALIISGTGTGVPTDLSDVQRVRSSCPSLKLFLGSGVSVQNVRQYLAVADGFIVGTSLKNAGSVPTRWIQSV